VFDHPCDIGQCHQTGAQHGVEIRDGVRQRPGEQQVQHHARGCRDGDGGPRNGLVWSDEAAPNIQAAAPGDAGGLRQHDLHRIVCLR
jgi:hypothetical protein